MLNIVVVRAHQADEGRKETSSYYTLSTHSSSHILSTHPLNTSSAHPLIHPLTHLPPPTPKPTYPLFPLAGINHGVVTRMFWALANPLGNIRNFDDENVRVSIVRELVARAYPQVYINTSHQHTLFCQHALSTHPILSTRPINTPYLVNTPYQHTLLIQHLNPPYQPTLPLCHPPSPPPFRSKLIFLNG